MRLQIQCHDHQTAYNAAAHVAYTRRFNGVANGRWESSLGAEANGSRAVRQFDLKWTVDREEQSEVHAIGGLCMAAKRSNAQMLKSSGTKIDAVVTVHSGDKRLSILGVGD